MDKQLDLEIGRDDEIQNTLDLVMKTEARHRGMVISHAETVNFFLSIFLSSIKSENKDELEKLFINDYGPAGLGSNIGVFRGLRSRIEKELSKLLEGYKFDEILEQLDEVCEERNKMAHATSNRFQEIMEKDISILHTTSFYIYQNNKTQAVEKMSRTDEDCKKTLGTISLLLVKLITIQKHVNPTADTSGIYQQLGVDR
jgi:hypothetical protein